MLEILLCANILARSFINRQWPHDEAAMMQLWGRLGYFRVPFLGQPERGILLLAASDSEQDWLPTHGNASGARLIRARQSANEHASPLQKQPLCSHGNLRIRHSAVTSLNQGNAVTYWQSTQRWTILHLQAMPVESLPQLSRHEHIEELLQNLIQIPAGDAV